MALLPEQIQITRQFWLYYREDLRRNPDNGWALFGLAQSLQAQGRAAEAETARSSFSAAWGNADIELAASRL